MLNDSYWEEYDNGTIAYLFAPDGEGIAYIQRRDTTWHCQILSTLIAETFEYFGLSTIEEVEWQITLYINKRCTVVANELHKIRDHLPSIHELADKAGICTGKGWEND